MIAQAIISAKIVSLIYTLTFIIMMDKTSKFTHPKYKLLSSSLKALSERVINLLILKGEAGWSKSYSTEKYLTDKKIDYAHINSYTTPLQFYNLLHTYKDKQVIVIDDTHGMGDSKILAMLKGACWGLLNNKRKVSYHTTAKEFEKLALPETFDLNANIILIMNNEIQGFEPIIDRGVMIEFRFSFEDKMAILESIQEEAGIEQEVIDYMKWNCSEATRNLSIRSAVTLSRLAQNNFDLHLFADEILALDGEKYAILDLVQKCNRIEDACKEWIQLTGKSRRTFFYYYAKMKSKVKGK